MVTPNDQTYYLLYDEFKVAAETDDYRLTVGNYHNPGIGTAIIEPFYGFIHQHNQTRFSAIDRDNDADIGHCAQVCFDFSKFIYSSLFIFCFIHSFIRPIIHSFIHSFVN